MFCTQCGNKDYNNGNFCSECGNPIETHIQQTAATSTETIPDKTIPLDITPVITNPTINNIINHKIAIGLIIIAMILAVSIYFNNTDSPENTVKEFESAFNMGDANKLLDTIDPRISGGLRATLNIAGRFVGMDANDLLNLIPFLHYVFEGVATQIHIDILSTSLNKDEAVVSTAIDYGSNTVNAQFLMVKKDGNWYIKNIRTQ